MNIFNFIYVEIPIRLCRHVGLQWVSTDMSVYDWAFRSPMKHVHCPGLRWVSDQACRSPIGLRWVSDNNNICRELAIF